MSANAKNWVKINPALAEISSAIYQFFCVSTNKCMQLLPSLSMELLD